MWHCPIVTVTLWQSISIQGRPRAARAAKNLRHPWLQREIPPLLLFLVPAPNVFENKCKSFLKLDPSLCVRETKSILPLSSPCLGFSAPNRRSPLGSAHHLGRIFQNTFLPLSLIEAQSLVTIRECTMLKLWKQGLNIKLWSGQLWRKKFNANFLRIWAKFWRMMYKHPNIWRNNLFSKVLEKGGENSEKIPYPPPHYKFQCNV